jgi:peptidoglycan-associated lipoprotein
MNARLSVVATVAAVALITAACGGPPPAAEPPAPVVNQDSIDAANAARAAAEAAERERAAAEARARAEAEAAERARLEAEAAARRMAEEARARAAAMMAERIHFALDQSTLSAEARATLDAKLPLLRANAAVRIRISGHADDRGSDSYNVALGQRRAAAAKRYLVDQGIAADRIETVSFGEERPMAMGADETAWSQNRRAEFEIIVGGETLRLP